MPLGSYLDLRGCFEGLDHSREPAEMWSSGGEFLWVADQGWVNVQRVTTGKK